MVILFKHVITIIIIIIIIIIINSRRGVARLNSKNLTVVVWANVMNEQRQINNLISWKLLLKNP